MVEQEFQDKKIAREARSINDKADRLRQKAL
jgi:hypothetical protein